MAYLISLPVELSPGKQIKNTIECKIEVPFGKYTLGIHRNYDKYDFTVKYFDSDDEAEAFLPSLGASLYWASLQYQFGVNFSLDAERPKYFDKPIIPKDENLRELLKKKGSSVCEGHYSGNSTVILRDTPGLLKVTGGPVGFIQAYDPGKMAETMAFALERDGVAAVLGDRKMKLALEIFSSSRFESSSKSEFISLLMTLEALTEGKRESDTIIFAIERLTVEISKMKDHFNKESSEYTDLDSLSSRVGNLKNQSITKQISAIIRDVNIEFSDCWLMDANKWSSDLYELRSRLVHGRRINHNELDTALGHLREILPNILKERFISISESTA